MKKIIDLFAILAVIGMAAMMTGCGGGDDDDDDNTPPPATQFAPASLANQSVTLTENGQSREIQFAVNGDTFTQFETGTTNAVGNGTFQWTRQGDNNGQLVLTTTGEGGATVTYVLSFTSATAGTYTFTTSGGQTGSGSFSNLHTITPGGNDGGNNGGNDGGNNGGGEIPTSLSGRVIDFTAAGQGNERLTFSPTGNTVTSDVIPNAVGTFTFTPGTGGAPGTLVVNFPNGDVYNLQLVFTDATHGTWSGNQRFENADHPVPAGSSFTIQP